MNKKHLPPDLAENSFFDASDTTQVKYEMLRTKATTKKSVVEVCREFNFSRRAFYDIKERFDEEGLPGLVEKMPGPRSRHKVNAGRPAKATDTGVSSPVSRPGQAGPAN